MKTLTSLLSMLITAVVLALMSHAQAATISSKEASMKLTSLMFADRYCGVKADPVEMVRLATDARSYDKEASVMAVLKAHMFVAQTLNRTLEGKHELVRVCGQMMSEYPQSFE